jgi:hypothetical protein
MLDRKKRNGKKRNERPTKAAVHLSWLWTNARSSACRGIPASQQRTSREWNRPLYSRYMRSRCEITALHAMMRVNLGGKVLSDELIDKSVFGWRSGTRLLVILSRA